MIGYAGFSHEMLRSLGEAAIVLGASVGLWIILILIGRRGRGR